MEIVIACLIATYVVKNGVIDAAYAVRGKPSPRRSIAHELLKHRAAVRRPVDGADPSAFRRYLSQLWEDSWDEAREKHDRRLHKRRQRRVERDTSNHGPGALQHYLRTLKADAWEGWDRRWDKASAKRHERRTAGQAQALAAALIAAADATDAHRGSGRRGDGNDQQSSDPTILEDDPDDQADDDPALPPRDHQGCWWQTSYGSPEGSDWCGEPATHRWHDRATGRRMDALCIEHADELADQLTFEPRPVDPPTPIAAPNDTSGFPDTADSADFTGAAGETASAPTDGGELATVHSLNGSIQEAPAVTATTSGETITLSQTIGAIDSWEESTRQAITSLETSIANLQGSEVGPAVTGPLGKAQEAFSQAMAAFGEARDGLEPSAQIGDMYHSNPDAGDRDFVSG